MGCMTLMRKYAIEGKYREIKIKINLNNTIQWDTLKIILPYFGTCDLLHE